jgi:hypothetical protein
VSSEARSELLTQEGIKSSVGYLKYWKRLVDLASFIWVVSFIVSVLSYSSDLITVDPTILNVTDTLSLLMFPVFAADLAIEYRLTGCSKTFLRKNWLSMIAVVPYFRIFKILSVVRLTALIRLGALPRTWGVILNTLKAIYRIMKFIGLAFRK